MKKATCPECKVPRLVVKRAKSFWFRAHKSHWPYSADPIHRSQHNPVCIASGKRVAPERVTPVFD